jgi:hypothetical protein
MESATTPGASIANAFAILHRGGIEQLGVNTSHGCEGEGQDLGYPSQRQQGSSLAGQRSKKRLDELTFM